MIEHSPEVRGIVEDSVVRYSRILGTVINSEVVNKDVKKREIVKNQRPSGRKRVQTAPQPFKPRKLGDRSLEALGKVQEDIQQLSRKLRKEFGITLSGEIDEKLKDLEDRGLSVEELEAIYEDIEREVKTASEPAYRLLQKEREHATREFGFYLLKEAGRALEALEKAKEKSNELDRDEERAANLDKEEDFLAAAQLRREISAKRQRVQDEMTAAKSVFRSIAFLTLVQKELLDWPSSQTRKAIGEELFMADLDPEFEKETLDNLVDLAFRGEKERLFLYITDQERRNEIDAALWYFLGALGHRVGIVESDRVEEEKWLQQMEAFIDQFPPLKQLREGEKLAVIKGGEASHGFKPTDPQKILDEEKGFSDRRKFRVVISKGQGNLYSLSTRNRMKAPVLALLVSKGMVAGWVTGYEKVGEKYQPVIAWIPEGKQLVHPYQVDASDPSNRNPFYGSIKDYRENRDVEVSPGAVFGEKSSKDGGQEVALRGKTTVEEGAHLTADINAEDTFFEGSAEVRNSTFENSYIFGKVSDSVLKNELVVWGEAVSNWPQVRNKRLAVFLEKTGEFLPGAYPIKEAEIRDILTYFRNEVIGHFDTKTGKWVEGLYERAIQDEDKRVKAIAETDTFLKSDFVRSLTAEQIWRYIHGKTRQYRDPDSDPSYYLQDSEVQKARGRVRKFVAEKLGEIEILAGGREPNALRQDEKFQELFNKVVELVTYANLFDPQSAEARRVFRRQGFFSRLEENLRKAVRGKYVLSDNRSRFEDFAFAKESHFLYLTDNALEVEFDALLWYLLVKLGHTVTVAGKAHPVLGDVSKEEIEQMIEGFKPLRTLKSEGKIVVISSGSDTYGTLLDRASDEFRAAFETSDLLISKGQGNLFTLSVHNRLKKPIAHLSLVKGMTARKVFNLPEGTPISPLIAWIEPGKTVRDSVTSHGTLTENQPKRAKDGGDHGQVSFGVRPVLEGFKPPWVEVYP